MRIGERARRSGLSAHTLRYDERIGLLPSADRDRTRQRDYDAAILTWIAFLVRLERTGMPIRDMLRDAALRERASGTETERCRLLEQHRARVRAQVAELQACLLVLDTKIAGYGGRHLAILPFEGRLIAIAFAPLGTEAIAIISMRPASRQERRIYAEA